MVRSPERCRYGTFTLRGGPDGVVHLDSDLPEVVALGTEAAKEFRDGAPVLGGPHAEWTAKNDGQHRLHVTTPEAEFTYVVFDAARDEAGWYFLMRLTFTSKSYHAFLAGH